MCTVREKNPKSVRPRPNNSTALFVSGLGQGQKKLAQDERTRISPVKKSRKFRFISAFVENGSCKGSGLSSVHPFVTGSEV